MKTGDEHLASLVQSLTHSDKAVVRSAIDGLVRLGIAKEEVQAALNGLFKQLAPETRWPVAYALAQESIPSIPCLDILIGALGSDDADIRWATVVLLSRLGKSDNRIFPQLADLLLTGGSLQKRMAVYCLRYLSSKQKAVHQVLHKTLQDADPLVRVAVVNTLAEHPPASKETMTVLRYILLQDADPRVRNAAEFALKRLGP